MADSESEQPPEVQEPRRHLPVLSCPILQAVKSAQAQHGLRHNDHARYRDYCTRKLRRLYRAHNFTHGRAKYARRTLEANSLSDGGQLMIPLVSAERAWALAMALKTDLEKNRNPRKRLHLVRRLAKATKHADTLCSLAAARADTRTALEAAAYAAAMAGTWLMEKESDWGLALKKLSRAQRICQELAKVGQPDQVAVTQQQLSELEPPLRYARYQLQRSGQPAPDDGSEPDSPSVATLHTKLSALAEEGGDIVMASEPRGAGIFTWRGEAYPVQAERVRASLAVAGEVGATLSSMPDSPDQAGERLAALDRQIAALNEAKGYVRHALSTTAGGAASSASDAQSDLRALNTAVTGAQLEGTLARGSLAVARAESSLEQALRGTAGAGSSTQADVRPHEVVRMYDGLASSCKELGEVAAQLGGSAGELLADECAAKAAQFQAGRCYFAAHAHLAAGNPHAAYALFARVADRTESAISQHQDCAKVDEAAVQYLEGLARTAQAWRCMAQAECAAQKQQEVDQASSKVEALSLEEQTGPKGYLLDNLHKWEAFAGEPGQEPRLFPIPPRLSLIPMRPFMLDAAQSFITPPSLEHRMKPEQKTGGIASLFGWRK